MYHRIISLKKNSLLAARSKQLYMYTNNVFSTCNNNVFSTSNNNVFSTCNNNVFSTSNNNVSHIIDEVLQIIVWSFQEKIYLNTKKLSR